MQSTVSSLVAHRLQRRPRFLADGPQPPHELFPLLLPLGLQRELAAPAGISLSESSAVLLGKRSPSPSTLTKLCMAVSRLRRAESDEADQAKTVLDEVRRHCKGSGLRDFARRAGVDPANLNRVLKGRTEPNLLMLAKLEAYLAEEL